MGFGDQLIATGLAKGAAARGKRIAFGKEGRILWDRPQSFEVFRNNPNIAEPGSENSRDIEWIGYHKGARGYNRQGRGVWLWNMHWKCEPGEMFFDQEEKKEASSFGEKFIVIEPNVETWKSASANKDWGFEKYQKVANSLSGRIVQFSYPKTNGLLKGVEHIKTKSFRHALSILSKACLYIGAEGGLHHGAAAVGIPAVVIFGGWIPPAVTGYESHINISVGSKFCGSLFPCQHCRDALELISVDTVIQAAMSQLHD